MEIRADLRPVHRMVLRRWTIGQHDGLAIAVVTRYDAPWCSHF